MTPSCSNSQSVREGPTKPHIGPSRKSHARYHLYPSLEQQWAYYARYIDFMLREPARGMAGFEVRGENIPRCPRCGWQLAPWVRNDTFLQGAARREGLRRYECFVRERGDGRVLLLELGVGEMTPGIITLPFWSMAAKLPDAHLFERKHLGRRGPGESLEAIQPGLAERGIITRTGPLYGRAYLTEQRTTSHSGARSSPCFTRFLLLAIRNRLVDKLVECCALLGGADGSHDWIPYDVAILIDDIRCREREQI